ncbi:MAG TPA: flippase-like domain-containing protein [Solirubrobacterales bacterium]|nr:flippase-like domain-containing protein [Solirubrobacterales bacterium]
MAGREGVTGPARGNGSSQFEPRVLARRSIPAFVAIAVLILVALLAPGLDEVRDLLPDADPGWIAVAIGFEALSFASYIVMFAPVFCHGLGWRRSWQIGGSELAMGSIVPASGLGGLALGAWVLHEGGMDGDRIARRSVAFFLIKSSVNFAAVAVIGLLMFAGWFGVDEPWTLTLLPASMSIALITAVLLVPRFGPGPDPGAGASRATRFMAASRRALISGTGTAIEIVRSGNARVIAGAIGYWAFDNAVLWATFHAFGYTPEISIVLMGYLIGQLGGLLPIPGGIGGIDGGLIGTLIVYGAPAAIVTAAVLAYRVILFWLPLLVGGLAFFDLRRDMPRDGELATCEAAATAAAAR